MLAKKRLPQGVAGIGRLHELTGRFVLAGGGDVRVRAGIGTGHGPWVMALIAAGCTVFAVNPLRAARYRDRHAVPGAGSGGLDAHVLAGAVRSGAHQLRPAAAGRPGAEGIKVVARAHETLVWERTAATRRLRDWLPGYFPAAAGAFGEGLGAPDVLELPGAAPDPARAAKLARARVPAVLKRAGRKDQGPD